MLMFAQSLSLYTRTLSLFVRTLWLFTHTISVFTRTFSLFKQLMLQVNYNIVHARYALFTRTKHYIVHPKCPKSAPSLFFFSFGLADFAVLEIYILCIHHEIVEYDDPILLRGACTPVVVYTR